MGMSRRFRELRYVYGWRLRHWWMATDSGKRAHVVAFCIAVLVAIAHLALVAVAAALPPPPGEPTKAIVWWVQLIIMVIAAVVAYALKPDPPEATARQVEAKTVEDGTPVKDYGGTVWIDHD